MNKLIMTSLASILALASVTASAGDAAAGKEKAAACAGCHGAEGTSPAGTFPHLGGQYENYLLHALKAYKSGKRQNPVMQGMVAALSDHDLENLAAYFASQAGPLRAKK